MPAIRWILPIVDDNWLGIVPGLVDIADRDIDHALSCGDVGYDDCVRAAWDAISVASGLPWWVAARLVHVATQNPVVAGELTLRRVDAEQISLGAFVCAIYRILVNETDKKQRGKIDMELQVPPAGAIPHDSDTASDLFHQMARSRGVQM